MPRATKAAPKKQTASAKAKALAKFEETFDKTYGGGRLVTEEAERPYLVVPTGSLTLDYSMGVGGWVLGRLSELWGLDDVGKTTLALRSLADAQRLYPDLLVAWIDMEHKWDWPWARTHGLLTARDRFKLVEPEDAEEVADQMKDLIRSGLFSAVVLDSIGAMIPEAEKEKDADEAVVANQAKIVTRMVKIAAVEAARHGVAPIMLNQVRANIAKYGDPTTTGGGFALKHCTTHKVRLKRGEAVKVGKQEVGHQVITMVERNKVAPPRQRAEFTLIHTESDRYGPPGIDRVDEAVTMGLQTGVIGQEGVYYTLPDTGERVKGREHVIEALRADLSLVDVIRTRVLATVADRVIVGEQAAVDLSALNENGATPALRETSDEEHD